MTCDFLLLSISEDVHLFNQMLKSISKSDILYITQYKFGVMKKTGKHSSSIVYIDRAYEGIFQGGRGGQLHTKFAWMCVFKSDGHGSFLGSK